MMWVVQHKWPSGAQFSFNCYLYWATLVTRAGDGIGNFLHIKEGVTQWDPLEIIAYGLGIIPLIRDLWAAHPGITQPWYADNAGAAGTFADICQNMANLMV